MTTAKARGFNGYGRFRSDAPDATRPRRRPERDHPWHGEYDVGQVDKSEEDALIGHGGPPCPVCGRTRYLTPDTRTWCRRCGHRP